MKLKVVTLNAGLMSLFAGRVAFSPFVEERLVELPNALRDLNADIVALQEVYRERHREWITRRLRDMYPFVAYSRKRHNIGLENSLMVLSKTRLTAELTLFKNAPLDEKLFDNKGSLTCEVEVGNHRITLINFHTTAGGLWHHPESSKSNRIRTAQIEQILSTADARPEITLMVGDLNAGPRVSEENFRQVLKHGYTSAYDFLKGGDAGCTWDPLNALNRKSPHKGCPPQRIDHIFIRDTDLCSGRILPLEGSLCCSGEVVPIPNDCKVTVSDHFGLEIEFEFRG